ncbi:hypothetical protein C8R45DRAFT_155360 [Mycena sanguinolenta]|nr:hypothetical protein C8R45DRAFT_155360 [Mycena sanguinolenta]
MNARIERADAALKDARTRLDKIAGGGLKKQNKSSINRILTDFQSILGILTGITDENEERAKTVAFSFMGVIQLEVDRRDNDEEIVAVCYSMTSMVSVLRGLSGTHLSNEELDDCVEEMNSAMKEFGEFVDVYYSKCGSWIVRHQRATEFQDKLHYFAENFLTIEFKHSPSLVGEEFQTAQTPDVQKSIRDLINRVGDANSEEKRQARIQIEHGSLNSQGGIAKITKILKEPVTSSLQEALTNDFETLQEQNKARYDLKLRGTKMILQEKIASEKILDRMTGGPHDLLEDPDMKKIWQDNPWGMAVKCRVFADAVSNYYTEEFRRSPREDQWTLNVLREVLYYPGIGEAIDDDASGFISVHELDQFVRKKDSTVSTPVWFAFWAAGLPIINVLYTDGIQDILYDIENRLNNLVHDDPNSELSVKGYQDTLNLIHCILNWNAWGGYGPEELEKNPPLTDFARQVANGQAELFGQILQSVDYFLEDGTLRGLTADAGDRIEQTILILLYVILAKHRDSISAEDSSGADTASMYREMDCTLTVAVVEFHWRYKALERSWRSQRLDIQLQVQSYAGGLFSGWYAEYMKTPSLVVKFLENGGEDETDEDTDTTETKIDQLSEQMKALDGRLQAVDGRLEGIESLLKQMMARGVGAPEMSQQDPGQTNDGFEIDQSGQADDPEPGYTGDQTGEGGDWGSDQMGGQGDPDEY